MDSDVNSQQLVRLLAEESRRRVVAALVLADGGQSTAGLVAAAGVDVRLVVDALDRLVTGGMVDHVGELFVLRHEIFQQAARAEVPAAPPSAHGDQPANVARVLDVAFKDGKLVQWPAKRTKRLVVLDHLAQQFDIGKRYKEADVNEMLKQFNDDVATMRRYLVDEQFLDRGAGEYWRCGGSF